MHPEPSGGGGLTSVISNKGYLSPMRDPSLLVQRMDVAPIIEPSIHEKIYERPNSLGREDGLSVAIAESNILFVDGLPTDCTRREVGRILYIVFSFIISLLKV